MVLPLNSTEVRSVVTAGSLPGCVTSLSVSAINSLKEITNIVVLSHFVEKKKSISFLLLHSAATATTLGCY